MTTEPTGGDKGDSTASPYTGEIRQYVTGIWLGDNRPTSTVFFTEGGIPMATVTDDDKVVIDWAQVERTASIFKRNDVVGAVARIMIAVRDRKYTEV